MLSSTNEAIQALKIVPYFMHMTESEANELANRLVVRHFNPDQIIFHLGDPGGLLYIISSGKVKISRSTIDGQEAFLAILGKGAFFGEMALLDDSPRSATAEALEPTVTLTLHRDEFVSYLKSNPEFAMQVFNVLVQRIRGLNDQVSDIFFLDLPARLARQLLILADQHGRPDGGKTIIDLSLTQTDLAEMTGATRVSINKALGRFRRQNWVHVKGRRFTILDREALEHRIIIAGGS